MLPKGVLADTSVVKATVRSVAFATEVGAYTILYPFDGGSGRCTSNTPRQGKFHDPPLKKGEEAGGALPPKPPARATPSNTLQD